MIILVVPSMAAPLGPHHGKREYTPRGARDIQGQFDWPKPTVPENTPASANEPSSLPEHLYDKIGKQLRDTFARLPAPEGPESQHQQGPEPAKDDHVQQSSPSSVRAAPLEPPIPPEEPQKDDPQGRPENQAEADPPQPEQFQLTPELGSPESQTADRSVPPTLCVTCGVPSDKMCDACDKEICTRCAGRCVKCKRRPLCGTCITFSGHGCFVDQVEQQARAWKSNVDNREEVQEEMMSRGAQSLAHAWEQEQEVKA